MQEVAQTLRSRTVSALTGNAPDALTIVFVDVESVSFFRRCNLASWNGKLGPPKGHCDPFSLSPSSARLTCHRAVSGIRMSLLASAPDAQQTVHYRMLLHAWGLSLHGYASVRACSWALPDLPVQGALVDPVRLLLILYRRMLRVPGRGRIRPFKRC